MSRNKETETTPENVIELSACAIKIQPRPSVAANHVDIPTARSNNELIKGYLSEIRLLCVRIETLIAINNL